MMRKTTCIRMNTVSQVMKKRKMFIPSSTSAPSNTVHSGMHTNVSFTSASFSSLAHSVRQKPSFSSMAVRYQARRRRSGEPLRGS
ncbi:hypothetical protein EYF80_043732 [Liparis tanakae]|uniref:Uncharacterized protein n=1 Tax=Liparis tanakae TaxID=230148 RepID=A0A4Z2FXP6_9TELE|nr:hypothetical protein EYF80_043732 [Liparis tanakae]